MTKNQNAYLLSSALLLAGCQSSSMPPTGLPTDIHSPTGPVVLAIKNDIQAGRLSRPIGNNATEKLHRLTVIDPKDANIPQFSNEIALRLVTLGQKAYIKKEYGLASQHTQRALAVAPEHAKALALLDAIRKAQKFAEE